MHGKIRRLEIGILIVALCLALPRFAYASEPLEIVRKAVDKAIQILKDPKLQSPDMKAERIDR